MPIPVSVLLGFAGWTLALLISTVGVYRWSRIFTGRAGVGYWRADEPQGDEWYRRAMRAHANCLENLPIYTALVVSMLAAKAGSPALDGLAIAVLAARICQSCVHILLPQTDVIAGVRFAFYFVQVIAMSAMGVLIARSAL